jgi:hypothetical protein
MLFGFFRSAARRAQAKITAGHIAEAIDSGSAGLFLGSENRDISTAVLNDGFVVSRVAPTLPFMSATLKKPGHGRVRTRG